MAALSAIIAVALVSSQPAQAGTAHATNLAGHTTKLLVRYATASACVIVPNYPASGVVGNAANQWSIPAGGCPGLRRT
jgi:hypothetical protein